MYLQLNANLPQPLFRQIEQQLLSLLRQGDLKGGDRLPSSRQLAQQLQIDRSTVERAYAELCSAGYLETQPRRGVCVRLSPLIEVSVLPAVAMTEPAQGAVISHNFVPITPHPRLFPELEWRRWLTRATARHGGQLLGYAMDQGYGPLREWLSGHLRRHQIAATADDLLLTQGAQAALALLIRTLVKPGDTVVVEDPTYSLILPLLHLAGARILTVPLTAEGPDLTVLDQHLRQRPVLFYTMPSFQNPTGWSSDLHHREALVSRCQAAGIWMIEDGFIEDLTFHGSPLPALRALDGGRRVIHVGTISKTLGPGWRTGWIIMPPVLREVLLMRHRAETLGGSLLLQAALHEVCASGRFERHLRRLQRHYRPLMTTALTLLNTGLPASWSCTVPRGGYVLWLTRPDGMADEPSLITALAAAGIAVAPGQPDFAHGSPHLHLRLSLAQQDRHSLGDGLTRLCQVLTSVETGRVPR